jgi:hypothetical protein
VKWRADSAEGLVIEIASGLQDEAKRPCKAARAFRIEDEQAWDESWALFHHAVQPLEKEYVDSPCSLVAVRIV